MYWRLFVCLLALWHPEDAATSEELAGHLRGSVRARHRRHVQIVPPGCGNDIKTLTSPQQIESPNYPKPYPTNMKCRWKIIAPEGKIVRFRFMDFDLEVPYSVCKFDKVEIYNGVNDTSVPIATLCGKDIPNPVRSSGRFAFFQFISDVSDVGNGFWVYLQFVKPETGSGLGPNQRQSCDSQTPLLNPTQTIVSPFDPNNLEHYPNHANCVWRINAPPDQHIKLIPSALKPFHLEASAGCVYDFLSVYDGDSENSLILGRYCGTNFPQNGVESSGSDMYVVFSADQSLTEPGFELVFEFIPPPIASVNCSDLLEDVSGQLTSPNFGGDNYPNNANCTWVIDVDDNNVVKLEFVAFDIEGEPPTCLYDYVNVYDGPDKNSPMLGSFCGETNPGIIESTGQYLLVQFVSDRYIIKKGFAANYTAIAWQNASKVMPGCGADRPANLQEAEGTILSPVQTCPSRNYPGNANCQWRVTVPTGKRAHLHVEHFSLEESDSCRYDNLEVFDGSDVKSNMLGRYCGKDIPGDITATSNVILVQFVSDLSVTSAGFNITYSAKDIGGTGTGNGDITEPACGISEVAPKFARIVGGMVAMPHSWPWQISLRQFGGHVCGGSILSKRWAITAAHCIHGGTASQFSILVGDHNQKEDEPGEQVLNVVQVIEHEHYNPIAIEHDIALLKLDADVLYHRHAKPICLPRGDVPVDMICVTTGWGSTQGSGDGSTLNQVRIPVIDREMCRRDDWYGSFFTPAMVCAGFPEGGKDACQGDSGGPLVCRENGMFRLHGITSWGVGCAQPKKPGIYTRVARYTDWVDMNTRGAFQSPP